jgi:hypothetical protein
MLENRPKYRLKILLALLVVTLMPMGGCKLLEESKWFPFFKPEVEPYEEICEETEVDLKAVERYYDSLRMLESQRFHDSCEFVLQNEWDSVLRTLEPEVSFMDLLADSIIDYAKRFTGVPYRSGGNGPKIFDCSGFTLFVFKHFGYSLKRTVLGQLQDGWKEIDNPDELRRGDLVFYGARRNPQKLGHVAIVVDSYPEEHYFTFIHATVKLGVTISNSTEKYYRIRYLTACRILPE